MGYMKIPNLYKDKTVLMFKRVIVLEKIHGTSAHIKFKDGGITYYGGGVKHEDFKALFNEAKLLQAHADASLPDGLTIHGEAYGGKMQAMKATYGDKLKFVGFDVRVNEGRWFEVSEANEICTTLGLDFVWWSEAECDVETLNYYRDMPSVQAVRNGIEEPRKAEGIVIKPCKEMTYHGGRVIAKHKRDDFMETKTPRNLSDEKLKVLEEASAIAEEWITPMRVMHVLGKHDEITDQMIGQLIQEVVADVLTEGAGEIVDSTAARRAIGKKAASIIKELRSNVEGIL